MLNIVYGIQGVLIIAVFTLVGVTMSGAQRIAPYLMPLILVLSSIIITTRGGMSISEFYNKSVSTTDLARMYLWGALCGIIAVLLYIVII